MKKPLFLRGGIRGLRVGAPVVAPRHPCDNTGKVEPGGRGHTALLSSGDTEYLSNEKRAPGWLGYIGHYTTHVI